MAVQGTSYNFLKKGTVDNMKTLYKVTTYYKTGLRSNVAAFESETAAERYKEYAERQGLRVEIIRIREVE